jgi:hypothetical protein
LFATFNGHVTPPSQTLCALYASGAPFVSSLYDNSVIRAVGKEGSALMGDVISIAYSIVIFALLIGYVFGCEKV